MESVLADALIGRVLDRRYHVRSRIAHGGMATVYLANDTRLDRQVALGLLLSEHLNDPHEALATHRAVIAAAPSHEGALSALTKDVFGEATSDPARAGELLDKNTSGSEEDPLPHVDAFDVMVQLSEAVPEGMVHDIEELDVQRGHVSIHGIAPTIPDAQQIAAQLKGVRCFQDVKIVRTNQEVGGDRQKYTMEFDLKCPTEGKEKGAAAGASSAAPSSSGGPKP